MNSNEEIGLIHRLTYRRTNQKNLHVRGYKEEGTITTAFDMTVRYDLYRFHFVMGAIDRSPQTDEKGSISSRSFRTRALSTSNTSTNMAKTCRKYGIGMGIRNDAKETNEMRKSWMTVAVLLPALNLTGCGYNVLDYACSCWLAA